MMEGVIERAREWIRKYDHKYSTDAALIRDLLAEIERLLAENKWLRQWDRAEDAAVEQMSAEIERLQSECVSAERLRLHNAQRAIAAEQRVAELEAEIKRLRAIVAKLPVTADGVPVLRQDRVWWPNDLSRGYYPDEVPVSDCYSTREAAEAAIGGQR